MERIESKTDLFEWIKMDSTNYKEYYNGGIFSWRTLLHQSRTSPISDQWFIWKYIHTMRICEYHLNQATFFHSVIGRWYLYKLRKVSRITGFQIPPGTMGPGLTIWHWGPIIVNPLARIGRNCTLNPGVIVGHKTPGDPAPIIGDNVFIGGGAKVIGPIKIGDNVVIAPNAVVVKDVENNAKIGGVPAHLL